MDNERVAQITQDIHKGIAECRRQSNQTLLKRRYGTLSEQTKREIFQLEMSMCLESAYMTCIQRVNRTDPALSSIEICEPIVQEYKVRTSQESYTFADLNRPLQGAIPGAKATLPRAF